MSFDGRDFGDLDYTNSPRTGLSRRHWTSVADHLLVGSATYRTNQAWRYRFTTGASVNGEDSDDLESFARLALLAGFRLATVSTAPAEEWYGRILDGLEGAGLALANGRADAWPNLSPVAQPLVEASSVSLALAVAPQLLWEPLSKRAQVAILDWLGQGVGQDLRWNNWAFFDASISTFLEAAGRGDATRSRKRLLRRVDKWYLGDGWYSDGQGTCIDYYNAWAFHFYMPLLARLSRDGLLDSAAERVHTFLDTYDSLIDSAGAPIYFGRSLTYRFAAAAPFFSAHVLPGSTRPAGLDRSMASAMLRRFTREGAVSDGRLSLGWWGEQPAIAQGYSSGGSPLWAAKAFVGLLLDETDPVWREPEPDPNVLVTTAKTAALAGGVALVRRRPDGIATLHPVSLAKWPSWAPQALQQDPQYCRIAYSSVTAPVAQIDIPENSVRLEHRDRPAGYRGAVDWSATGHAWSATSAPVWHDTRSAAWITYRRARLLRAARRWWCPRAWSPARVGVLSVSHGHWEVRFVAFGGVPPGTAAHVGAYAIAGDHVRQQVVPVWGDLIADEWSSYDNTNPFGATVSVPGVKVSLDGSPCVIAVAIALTRAPLDSAPPVVRTSSDGVLSLTFPGGNRCFVTVHGTRMSVSDG